MEEQELRTLATKRAFFKRHFCIYLIVNVFLVAINYFTSPGYYWCLWAAGGWGLGIAIQGYLTYWGSTESLEEAEYKKLKDKQGK